MVAEQTRKTQGRRGGRLVLLAVIAVLIGAYVALDLGRWQSLEQLAAVRQNAAAAIAAHPVASAGVFFAAYVAMAALSLPGAAVMTLAGGALFGFGWGLLLVSFASSVGATLAMLISRSLLRDWVQARFGGQLGSINAGLARDGGFYLFSLRMVPLFPFFVVNLVMGLTPLSVRTFYGVSQIGMLPGTAVYVLAGTELARIDSLAGILSPGLVLAFTLLGLFPLLARKAMAWVQARRAAAAGGV
ncbi:MAG: TVP38/TMEM64 family protein [Gammaproteobacteria bacterium]